MLETGRCTECSRTSRRSASFYRIVDAILVAAFKLCLFIAGNVWFRNVYPWISTALTRPSVIHVWFVFIHTDCRASGSWAMLLTSFLLKATDKTTILLDRSFIFIWTLFWVYIHKYYCYAFLLSNENVGIFRKWILISYNYNIDRCKYKVVKIFYFS